jgi:hypothetical protein
MPNHRRRLLLQVGALSLLAPAAYTAEAQIAMATAINRTARFRALSQRIAKAYCQQFLNVENAREVLAAAQGLVQVGFADLGKAGFGTATAQQIANIQKEAAALQTLVAQAPTKASVLAASQQADQMLQAADTATESLQAQARVSSARLVNIAGRQRMLSQRLAKNYYLAAAGHDSKALQSQTSQDSKDFVDSLGEMNTSTMSTPGIRGELTLAQQQWIFFDSALQRKPDERALRVVGSTSERLLEVMNNLTVLYEGAVKDLLGNT